MDNTEYVVIQMINQLDVPLDVQKICFDLKDHPDYPSMLSISDVLKKWGINNAAFRPSFDQLTKLPLPFIAHLSTNHAEYALVSDIDNKHIKISNKTFRNHPVLIADFKGAYNSTVLIIDTKDVNKLRRLRKNATIKKADKKNNSLFNTEPLQQKITYLDIGASYGLPVKWEQYAADDLFELILVEPDKIQAEEIKKTYPKATIIPYALGNKNETATINITLAQACSSILNPDIKVLKRFPIKSAFNVLERVQVDVHRFEDMVAKYKLNKPHFVKIDVQGFEYAVLEGFGDVLDDVLCIELETHLVPIYEGEKALPEINDYLNSKGFYLRHLEIVGSFEGEVMEFDAYFVKRDEYIKPENEKQMIAFWESVNQIPEAKRFLR